MKLFGFSWVLQAVYGAFFTNRYTFDWLIQKDTIPRNNMLEEDYFVELELTFEKLGIKLTISQSLQNNPQMESMLFYIL